MIPVTVQLLKVAIPLTAARGLVAQTSVPAEAVKVIEATDVVAVLPLASWTVTTGWVVKEAALAAAAGCAVKANLAAAPADSTRLAEAVAVPAIPGLETANV